MELRLNYTDENGIVKRVSVNTEKFTIGRHSDNDLCIPKNQLSRRHAEIDRYEDSFILTDAGSSNGTTLNGNPLSRPTALRSGDRINFGGGAEVSVELIPGVSDFPQIVSPKSENSSSANENAAQTAEAEAVKEAEIVSEVKPADFAPAIAQSAPAQKSGMGIFFIIAPLMAFVVLIFGGLLLWLFKPEDNNLAKNSGRDVYTYSDDDDEKPNKNKRDENINKSSSPTSDANYNGGQNINNSSTPDNSTSTTNASTPVSSENDTAEKNALAFMRKIAKDNSPVLTQAQITEINSQIKMLKNSSALKNNLQSAKKNSAAIESLAKSKNLRPQFLAAAALAKLGNSSGDALATATTMAGDLNSLSNLIANELANDSLLIIAAYQEGGQQSRMPSMLGNLTKGAPQSAAEIRTIWYLHKNKKISDAQYNFALQFLAIGAIMQNPKDFGVQTEAVVFN